MMKYWKAGLFFLAAFLIQASLLNVISIRGYTPNLILGLVILFAFLYDDKMYGLIYGGLFGLLYDVIYSDIVGPTPIPLVLIAAMIIGIKKYVNMEHIFGMWITSIVFILFYYVANWGLFHVAGNPIGLHIVFETVPWTGLYTIAFITVLYLILKHRIKKHQKVRYFQ